MIIYEVSDSDDQRAYVSSKAEANREAKSFDPAYGGVITVTKLDLGKIDRAKVIALLGGGGYAEKQTTVWTSEKPNNRKEQQ